MPGSFVWVSGFGGCKITTAHDGSKARWPARVEHPDSGGPKVQKAKKVDRVLVKSFGDDRYVWAKPEALVICAVKDVEAALASASARVRPALEALLHAAKPPSKAKGRPAPAVQPPSPSLVTPEKQSPADGLSAYERKRLETIKQNEAALIALGVTSASEELRRAGTPEKKSVDPLVVAARAQERQRRLEEAQANKRQSSRLLTTPTIDRAPKRYAEQYSFYDDEEEAALYRESRKRMRTTGGIGRGSGSRGGKKAMANNLTEEERAAVARAFEQAEGWLEAMRTFFTDKLSEANLRNVMKQATALATGQGVPHKRYAARWFRKGEPVTLDEDMVALRAAANRFLLPEDDPGHGWCLDHPIGKMGIFQAYLHAKGRA